MDANKQILRIKINIKKKWLADNDYIINKVVLGEWQPEDERFINYKEQRAVVRAELDFLEAELAKEKI